MIEVISEDQAARMVTARTPLTVDDTKALRAGDRVRVTGDLYTARDAAHRRLAELDAAGEPWPFAAEGSVLYYVGPTPERPGHVIGSAGPTTASRMDPHLRMTLEHGVRATIGKGGRGADARTAITEFGAVYMAAIGGLGAVLARSIKSAEIVAFADLGTEAIRRLEVEAFPAVVVYDAGGGDLYTEAKEEWRGRAHASPPSGTRLPETGGSEVTIKGEGFADPESPHQREARGVDE